MRVHADLSFNCDVLSWDQSFQNAAFVREGLDSQIQLSVGFFFFFFLDDKFQHMGGTTTQEN